jgi:hypothetical protein
MNNNDCKDCQGCADTSIEIRPPASTTSPCVDPEPCSKVYQAGCVHVTGNLVCGEDTIATDGLRLPAALQTLLTFVCGNFLTGADIPPRDYTVTRAEAEALVDTSGIEVGAQYFISDRGILLIGVSQDTFSSFGSRLMPIVLPSYYGPSFPAGHLGIYDTTLTPSIGNTVLWGGRVWENTSGNVGSIVSEITLSPLDWAQIATSNTTYYVEKVFSITYDFQNDWVSSQSDDQGNTFGIPFDLETTLTYGYNWCDLSDWGKPFMLRNICYGAFNNKGILVVNNKIPGHISENGGDVVFNTNLGDIHQNAATVGYNSNSGRIYNNSNTGGITHNKNNGQIANLGATVTDVQYNTNNGEIVTTVVGAIADPIVNK